jgi:Flp pilus assembly protein CpaB
MERNVATDQQTAGSAKLVIVAVLLAMFAVVMTNFYIEMVRRDVASSSFDVYVLSRSVHPGDRLDKKITKLESVPDKFRKSFERMGAIDEASLKTRINDKKTFKRRASAGDIITFSLFDMPAGKDIDKHITVGLRMISLPINSRTVPGALHEGMYVDIEAGFLTGGAIAESLPVMERVKVIALGKSTVYDIDATDRRRRQRSYQTITIEVTPDEATQLRMVQYIMVGEFELHMRNPIDKSRSKIPDGGINAAVIQLIDRQRHQRVDPDASNSRRRRRQ